MIVRVAVIPCFAFMLAAWLAVAPPAQGQEAVPAVLDRDEKASLAAVERYLTGIRTLKADFRQVGPEGEPANGVFYLRRPGRLRVEYAPPVPVLIVGDGFLLHYHDTELGQVNSWFIFDTPLGALTRDEIRFGEDLVVTAFEERDGFIGITVVQESDPGAGSLTLVLSTDPLEMRLWRVRDPQGLVTTVTLHELETNIGLPPTLFVFDAPRPKTFNRP